MSNNQNDAQNEEKTQTGADKQASKSAAMSSRSFKYGSLATAITVVFIAIVILLNIVLSALNTRVSLGLDLTKDKTYALSATTVKYLGTINKDITVYVLATEKGMLATADFAETDKILRQFSLQNNHIHIEYVDLDANPTFKSKFPQETMNQTDIIVSDGSKYKHFTQADYFESTYDQSGNTTITGYKIEDQLDSAIAYLSAANLPKVIFTTGHEEGDSTGFGTLLKNNNYQILSQNISNTAIPDDAKAIAIFDPKNDLSSDEITKIDTFLTNGGKYGKNLLVFFDPTQKALPNLEGFIQEWGIQVGKGAIYDSNGYSTFQPLAGTLETSVIKSTTTAVNSDLANSRPLTLLFDTKDIRKTKSLVSTPNTSKLWNPTTDISSATFKASDSDQKGPFTVLALSTKTGDSGASNLLVSGSTDIVNSTLLQRSDLNNDKIVMDSVNYIMSYKSPITVDTKEKSSDSLNLTGTQQLVFVIIFIMVIPLVMLALALITYLRRRHL